MVEFIPTFPRYLLLTAVRMSDRRPPFLFEIDVQGLPDSNRTITLSGDALALINLADGTRTSSEILGELKQVNSDLSDAAFDGMLSDLRRERLLVDAAVTRLPNHNSRYARHGLFFSIFSDVPLDAQRRLSKADVAILGVGGIGTFVSYLLAAAGVGRLRLIDGDIVELSNLTRQVLYDTSDIGRPKVEVAKERLAEINPEVECVTHQVVGAPECFDETLKGSDLVVLSADRPFAMQQLVNRYCVRERIPWTFGGYAGLVGSSGPLIIPGTTGCLACADVDLEEVDLIQDLPLVGEINARFQPPSFGPLNAIVASCTAYNAVMFLAGLPAAAPGIGTLIQFEAATFQSQLHRLERRPDCPDCSDI
jgi:bacteriocin biosynthesis cyclodehydratase domain-containing protein